PDTAIVVAVPLAIAPANGNQDGLTEALLSDLDEIAPDLLLGDGTEESVEEGDDESCDLLASLDTPPVVASDTRVEEGDGEGSDLHTSLDTPPVVASDTRVEEGDGEGSDLLASLDTPPVAAPGTPLSDAEIQDADLALIGANLK